MASSLLATRPFFGIARKRRRFSGIHQLASQSGTRSSALRSSFGTPTAPLQGTALTPRLSRSPLHALTLHARRSRSLRQQPHILIDCLSYGTSHRKQLQSLLPFGLPMNLSQTAASKRRDTAVQSLLELIRLFEAEALWESVETIRAVLDRLRDWDLSAASRLFWRVDQLSPSATICSAGARNCIAERSAVIGSLLRSLTRVPCDSPDHLLEN